MLHSEFYDRTHVTLTGEEYADVECLYNAVKMNKDEFCKRWVAEKKNPLFKELAEAFCHEYRMHLADVNQLQATCKSLRDSYEECKRKHEEKLTELGEKHLQLREELAKKIIIAQCNGSEVLDAIEEDFGFGFIIRTKHEAGLPLSDEEISYMVGKL